MSRVVRYREAMVVEMHDNPCATPEDHEQVKRQLIEAGRASGRLVVDCAAVTSLGAAFLSALVTAFRSLGCRPGDLVLCRLRPLPREVFTVTHLDRLFPISET